MELKGLKVNFLGDSITQGAGASDEAHRYVNQFAAKTGAVVRNYGIGGTRIARSAKNANYADTFLDRAARMEADADLVVVFGGTNDFGHGDGVLGTPDSTDEYSFYGALDNLCRLLINKYPTAELVMMTPIHRKSENVTVNEIGLPCERLVRYVEAIRLVAARYSIPVLDLWSTSGIVPTVEINRETYAPDGLHPNDRGAERIADRLIAFLSHTL